jgi:hypothetical protein
MRPAAMLVDMERHTVSSEWFDQFDAFKPDDWHSNADQWCWRHWAPCPVMGANGIGMTLEIMSEFMKRYGEYGATTDRMNEIIVQHSPLCCTLGDQKMYELWGHWGPGE